MRIALYNILGEKTNGEQEMLTRLQYVFLKQNHEFFVVNRDGYVINKCSEQGRFIEDLNVDIAFTYDPLEFALVVLPDVFFSFLHWAPVGFFENFKARIYLESFHLYDHFACSGEQSLLKKYVQVPAENTVLFGPSVPLDYVIAPQLKSKRRLFYIGINFERALANMRYGELLSELDRTGQLEIYGPKKIYGQANLWAGFKSYRGEIPFDGHSVIKKIHHAGVCLALNSPMHNDADVVTSRTYEAAAAGAVIISDDNKFVHKYFGDSVFYIEQELSEKEASSKIIDILEWINKHPEESCDMACRSQHAFLERLTLDKMVASFMEDAGQAIARAYDIKLQPNVVDVICFLNDAEDYQIILAQLRRQFYQHLHLVLIADTYTCKKLSAGESCDVIAMDGELKGHAFIQAKAQLQGQYFMFMDRHSILHARHIYKNLEVLSSRNEFFAYSGCYLKRPGKKRRYVALNNKSILRDEFLLFSTALDENGGCIHKIQQAFHIEMLFSRCSGLFRRDILTHTSEAELSFISENVHMYLACCSLIKAGMTGRFTYALTAGYSGDTVKNMELNVFGYSRRYWYSKGRLERTYIDEFSRIFFPYNFECGGSGTRRRSFNGEPVWYSDL